MFMFMCYITQTHSRSRKLLLCHLLVSCLTNEEGIWLLINCNIRLEILHIRVP